MFSSHSSVYRWKSDVEFTSHRQNNVEELYSLLNFLCIRPLNDWTTFNEQINKPVKSGKGTRAMKRLHVSLFHFSRLSSQD